MKKVTLTIDGLKVRADQGSTVLQAALANGLYIPNLCNHPDLVPAGLCRVCVVKVDDWKITISCKLPVKEGMVISTEDPEVQRIRKSTVELLVANHPMTCLTCSRDANCELQRVASYVGINQDDLKRYRRSVRQLPLDSSNPFFDVDHSKCILCGICVRTCDELQNINAIDYVRRGVNTSIGTLGNKPIADSRCESCGECVVRCPVAALSPKDSPMPMREVKSICTYCGVGCGIQLGVRGDRVVGVRGDRDNPVNRGSLCVKGRYGFKFINHSDRLTTPLIRKEGVLVPASWDEALERVAANFSGHKKEQFAALASARITNEDNYLIQKFTRAVMQTNNIDHCARL
jgi:formate dehydrogenase (NADP+) alpha subunit